MEPHTHVNAVPILATGVVMVAIFGTLHLYALSTDSRLTRALTALGLGA